MALDPSAQGFIAPQTTVDPVKTTTPNAYGGNPWQQGAIQQVVPGSTQDVNGYHLPGANQNLNVGFGGIQQAIGGADGSNNADTNAPSSYVPQQTNPWLNMVQQGQSGLPQQNLNVPPIGVQQNTNNGLFGALGSGQRQTV